MGMNRREFGKGIAAAVGTAMMAGKVHAGGSNLITQPAVSSSVRRAGDKPNLLFLISDQRRADTMAAYGNTAYRVPVINRLASESVVFQHAYCTQPLCTPSRSSMLTGMWPHQNGCVHNNIGLKPDARVVPELLQNSDYRTGYFGKWHLGDEIFRQHGFDEWRSIEDSRYESYYSPGRDKNARSTYDHFLRSMGYKPDKVKDDYFSREFAAALPLEHTKASYLASEASKFIFENRRQPWLLYVSFLEPHPPQTGVLNDLLPQAETPLPKNYPGVPATPEPESYKKQRGPKKDNQAFFEERVHNYAGLCSVVDQALGRILWMLEVTGQSGNTIIVYTADHGDMMASHSMIGKGVMYEESIRVPHLLKVPFRTQKSLRIAQPVSHIDIVPTVMQLLGRDVADIPGRSLMPLLEGKRPPEDIFLEWTGDPESGNMPPGRIAVSPDGHKLVLYQTGVSMLFDRNRDPLEMNNVFGSREYAGVQAGLTKKIVAWQKQTGDNLELPV